jgi:hydroxymethylbilane synthase
MKVGCRGSSLSLAQAALAQQHYGEVWEQVVIHTEGDKDQKTPIAEMGGKAVFCNTIEKELLNGKIDVAIHSYKDMPGIKTDGLTVNVVLPRNNCKDYIIGDVTSKQSPIVGTSSPRRKAQIENMFEWVETKDIRGNIETRLAKLDNGDYDAIVLAGAGLDLLNIDVNQVVINNIPSVCQGIIALQTRIDDTKTNYAISRMNHYPTYYNSQVERALLESIGGDCHTALAGNVQGDLLVAEMFLENKHSGIVKIRKGVYHKPEDWGNAMADKLSERLQLR